LKVFEALLIAKATGQKKDSDLSAVIFTLKTRFHDTYGEKQKHEITGGGDGSLKIQFINADDKTT